MLFPVPGAAVALGSMSRSNASVALTSITWPTTAHTWSSPVQITASTPFDVGFVAIKSPTGTGVSAGRNDSLFELMIGGAGAEQTVATIMVGGRVGGAIRAYLPLFIPSGTRVSGRVKSNIATGSFSVTVDYYRAPPWASNLPTRWVTYGLVSDASNSKGTVVAPSATGGTFGSWTALTTSTTYEHELWVPMAQPGNQTALGAATFRTQWGIFDTASAPTGTTSTNGVPWEFSSATNSSEQFMMDWGWGTNVNGGVVANGLHPMWQPAPAGSAISARAVSNLSSPASESLTVAVMGAVM